MLVCMLPTQFYEYVKKITNTFMGTYTKYAYLLSDLTQAWYWLCYPQYQLNLHEKYKISQLRR